MHTGVIGSHWRTVLSEEPNSVVLANAEAAAHQAEKQQQQQLHELRVSTAKDKGVYASEQALKAMGVAPVAKRSQNSHTTETKSQTDAKRAAPAESPARYPAVSFFARMRELQSTHNSAGTSSLRDSRTTELRENAQRRTAQRFAEFAQKTEPSSEGDSDSDSANRDADHRRDATDNGRESRDATDNRRDATDDRRAATDDRVDDRDSRRAATDSLFGYDSRRGDDDYAGDIPDDRPSTESVGEYQERERRESQQRVQDAQGR
jgi:hypothetical protein